MVLEQKDVGWIRGSLEYLSVKPRQLRPGIADHLLAGNDIPVDLQLPVGTKYNHCGTEGRTEARPRWTKDIRPAFYAQARECRSETCKNKKRTFPGPPGMVSRLTRCVMTSGYLRQGATCRPKSACLT